MEEKALTKLEAILSSLWKMSRFVSYFYQGTEFFPDKNLPTIAITIYHSRLTLFFNPEFILKLPDEQIIGLLVHEMLHVVLNHNHRGNEDGDIYLQNVAQDMVINSYIIENKKTFFSKKSLYLHDTPEINLPAGLPTIPDDFLVKPKHLTLHGKMFING